jgi:hypothetical protein
MESRYCAVGLVASVAMGLTGCLFAELLGELLRPIGGYRVALNQGRCRPVAKLGQTGEYVSWFRDIEFEESIEGCLVLSAPRRLFAFRNQDIFEIGAFGFAERAPLANRSRELAVW